MFNSNKFLVALLSIFLVVSCGKKSNNTQTASKAKNTSLFSIWDGSDDNLSLSVDLTKAKLNQQGEITLTGKDSSDNETLKCTGTVTLKGSINSGNFSAITLTSVSPEPEKNKACSDYATDLNLSNILGPSLGATYNYDADNANLKLCYGIANACHDFK